MFLTTSVRFFQAEMLPRDDNLTNPIKLRVSQYFFFLDNVARMHGFQLITHIIERKC